MKFYSTKELAQELHCNVRQVGKLRQNGLITGIRAGHGYVFAESEIERFWATYRGCDLSSEEKMRCAKILRGGLS